MDSLVEHEKSFTTSGPVVLLCSSLCHFLLGNHLTVSFPWMPLTIILY